MRTLLWISGGVISGLMIHLIVVLALPAFATQTVWTRVAAAGPEGTVVVLPALAPGAPNPLQLDPGMSYAVCRIDLSHGPGVVNGTLPDAYWSLAIFNRAGSVVYSTTNRDGIGQNLNLGIFNADQTHLLAEQQIEIADGLLIVESPDDDIFVVVRMAPPHEEERARTEQALSRVVCGNI